MVTTGIIAVTVFILLIISILFLPKIKIGKIFISTYWLIALLGATAIIIFKLLPIEKVIDGLNENSAVNPLKILVLFFSMTMLSVFLDETGLFEFLAKKAVSVSGTGQFSLFIILYGLTSVLTVFTSNDIVILTLTPIVCVFCKTAKIDATPYLVGEFAAANTWSMALIIGNPTNIFLATKAEIGFAEYLKTMIIPTLSAGITEFLLIALIFFRKLKKPLEPIKEQTFLKDKLAVLIGVIHLSGCLILLALSDKIGVESWAICALFAVSLALFALALSFINKENLKRLGRTVIRLPYQLIPFVVSMFIIVLALEGSGIVGLLGEVLGEKSAVWVYGFSSAVSANLINNIPMSMLYSSLTSRLGSAVYEKAVYASVIGSNIGAFITPLGALAGIMFTSLTEKCGAKYGFKEFIKYGVIISVPTITVALAVLSVI